MKPQMILLILAQALQVLGIIWLIWQARQRSNLSNTLAILVGVGLLVSSALLWLDPSSFWLTWSVWLLPGLWLVAAWNVLFRAEVKWARKPITRTIFWLLFLLSIGTGYLFSIIQPLSNTINLQFALIGILLAILGWFLLQRLRWFGFILAGVALLIGALIALFGGLLWAIPLASGVVSLLFGSTEQRLRRSQDIMKNLREIKPRRK